LNAPSPWLFPGRWPGRALTEDALAQRLHALQISPRQGRSTALFTLAAEVPAAILAKTVGIHVQAAIQWQKISAGDWAAYAADVSRRATQQPVSSHHETPGQPLPPQPDARSAGQVPPATDRAAAVRPGTAPAPARPRPTGPASRPAAPQSSPLPDDTDLYG